MTEIESPSILEAQDTAAGSDVSSDEEGMPQSSSDVGIFNKYSGGQ